MDSPVFGHIKVNRSFRRFSLRGLEKVHTEFGIVDLVHNLLKVASIRLTAFLTKAQNKKSWTENMTFFRPTFYLGDLLDSPFFYFSASYAFFTKLNKYALPPLSG
ncbi:transposase [Aneurinibacillus aneurinilyticus]|uniref:transposase n=1 Tax=Aneurinibacillus aneurinilyticus TaxID=1391 RepID=UPI003B97BAC6